MRGILTAGDGVLMSYISILESLAQFYPITYISLNLAIGSILSYLVAYCWMSLKVAKYSLYTHIFNNHHGKLNYLTIPVAHQVLLVPLQLFHLGKEVH